jgi:hypothetical protein
MLPLGVLFVLFAVGVWAYCLIDAIMTPPEQLRSLTTMSWALLITVLPVIGAIAWLLAGRPDRRWRTPMMPQHLAGMPRLGPQEAIRRHPAGRAMEPGADGQQPESWDCPAAGRPGPIGPDDDPDFLRELERRFRDERDPGSNP